MRLEPLYPGDTVDIVAPASKCTREELGNGLKAIRELGLVPRVPSDLFARSLLFSNSDESRLRQLRAALFAPDSKAIWCVRGGYGALRLMPEIQKWRRPRLGKIFIGYSDITTLHTHLNQEWGWPTLHGPLLDRLGRKEAMSAGEKRELLALLFGRQKEVEFRRLRALNTAARAHTRGAVRAAVCGGNMAVLQSGLGTRGQLNPRGRILFFEDAGERPHRVDRMLTQFSQAGWFEGANAARAVVFGHMLLNDPRDRRWVWRDVIARFAAEHRLPVLAGLPVGHDPRVQYTLPLQTPARLNLGPKPSLVVQSPVKLP
ncbi:MAG: LD-carboxypeptidase [Bdellovibrionales bacterium]